MTATLSKRPKRRTDVYAFKQRVRGWADRIGVQPKELHIRTMTTKWASCSTTGRVTFSADLLRESAGWQQYVIVHELLHLRIRNHGKLFKAVLSALLPDWERTVQRQQAREPAGLGMAIAASGRRRLKALPL